MLQCVAAQITSDILYSVCCSHLLQCVAECCSVLQCVAVCCSANYQRHPLQIVSHCNIIQHMTATYCNALQHKHCNTTHQHTATHCNTLRHDPSATSSTVCVAVCCSVLQCVAVCCSVLQCVAVCCSVLQCVAVCCSVLRCIAVHCSVLHCNTMHLRHPLQNLSQSETATVAALLLHPPTITKF